MTVPLRELQALHNRSTSGEWRSFAQHRGRVTQLVELAANAAADPRRLCVLGSGNLNDLRIDRIINRFSEIHFVDIDQQATMQGLARQGYLRHPKMVVRNAVDLDDTPWLDEQFSVVLSAGVLTQLIDRARQDGGLGDNGSLSRALATRDRHLQLVVDLVETQGIALLVTDIVSSDTAPELRTGPTHRWPQELQELVAARNFFTGCNPNVLASKLANHPRTGAVGTASPWVWAMSPTRTYLTVAMLATVS